MEHGQLIIQNDANEKLNLYIEKKLMFDVHLNWTKAAVNPRTRMRSHANAVRSARKLSN